MSRTDEILQIMPAPAGMRAVFDKGIGCEGTDDAFELPVVSLAVVRVTYESDGSSESSNYVHGVVVQYDALEPAEQVNCYVKDGSAPTFKCYLDAGETLAALKSAWRASAERRANHKTTP